MPDPTPAQVLAVAGASGGRMSLAIAEAKRLLTAVLPGTVTEANTREGTTLPVPVANVATGRFYYAGESLLEAEFPAVAIGSNVRFVPLAGLAQRRINVLEVSVVQPRLEIGTQIITLWDLGELALLVLLAEQQRHCLPEPDGRSVWSYLKPLDMDVFSANSDNKSYAGVKVSFEMDQAGLSLWPQE